jgi:large subunit ribosomal protein L35
MPKMKTHAGAKKRLKKLKGGLFKAAHTSRRHKMLNKVQRVKRRLRRYFYIDSCDLNHVKQLLPY